METISLRKEDEALCRESGATLDLRRRLWIALVENGDFKSGEEIFDEGVADGQLDWYMSRQPYRPSWREMSTCSSQVEDRLWSGDSPSPPPAREHDLLCTDKDPRPNTSEASVSSAEIDDPSGSSSGTPGPRGGHQLCVDSTTGTLYLFGGFNGTEDLDDLWSFCTRTERWTLLCRHSALEGGPSPRSCHKCVFDPVNRRLYTLGRYLDNGQRVVSNLKSDLYMYDVVTRKWSLLCSDTAFDDGPRLVFEHQMCIDSDTQTIYVFGGRVLPRNTEDVTIPRYSGLYAYHITTNTWKLLLPDNHKLNAPQPRISHSMLFHPVQRRLYIFAGQRDKGLFADLWWWDVETGECKTMCRGAVFPLDTAVFTHRATIDPETDEIFVLSGMSKESDKRVSNTLWVFSLRRLTWTGMCRNDSVAPTEPRPRFAHQLVYDPATKIHYLFGGNPGIPSCPRVRLDDLWAMRLSRSPVGGVARTVRVALRVARYRELAARARRDPAHAAQALHYLRNDLHRVLDHSDPVQVSRFQKLATELFASPDPQKTAARALSMSRERALVWRYHTLPEHADLTFAIRMVLTANDRLPEPTEEFEQILQSTLDSWNIGTDIDMTQDDSETEAWKDRTKRIKLYDALCQYYKPIRVPPCGDITTLITL